MLKRNRNSLRSKRKISTYDIPYKEIEGNKHHVQETIVLINPMDGMGLPPTLPEYEEEIQQQQYRERQHYFQNEEIIMDAVGAILRDLGIKRPNDMFLYDLYDAMDFTYHIGERVDLENRMYALEILDYILSCEIYMDHTAIVNSFKRNEFDEWEPANVSSIKIVGHMHDGLYCPKCGKTYYDNRDILLAPVVSVATSNIKITQHSHDDINYCKSHMTLAPICPNCYCGSMSRSLEDNYTKNLSPVIMGIDSSREIIPLVPSCTDEIIKSNRNNYYSLTDLLFWPKEYKDAICLKYQRDYQSAED